MRGLPADSVCCILTDVLLIDTVRIETRRCKLPAAHFLKHLQL